MTQEQSFKRLEDYRNTERYVYDVDRLDDLVERAFNDEDASLSTFLELELLVNSLEVADHANALHALDGIYEYSKVWYGRLPQGLLEVFEN